MTREAAVTNLNMIRVAFVEPVTMEQRKLIDETFDTAIQALSQEPCRKDCRLCKEFDECEKSKKKHIGDVAIEKDRSL